MMIIIHSHAHAVSVYVMAKVLGWVAVYQTFNINHLSYTKTLVPIYRFCMVQPIFWRRLVPCERDHFS